MKNEKKNEKKNMDRKPKLNHQTSSRTLSITTVLQTNSSSSRISETTQNRLMTKDGGSNRYYGHPSQPRITQDHAQSQS
ncbi:hypothetical protein PGTUg99_017065 [Puccinia graminis f. sp. tritici]|uniref:Uncharacterized protein n=1 Tax=Puccinia graminis f. sp. tritici TaxID=56615 RepID=A0A5B0S4C8_PUCGR|nr:hypothetical protein PGTUg99_017065 [Puccinia graminis f. sp. tritici]